MLSSRAKHGVGSGDACGDDVRQASFFLCLCIEAAESPQTKQNKQTNKLVLNM